MAFVSNQMPLQQKRSLTERFKATFDNEPVLTSRDPYEQDAEGFETIHFAIYNRYGTSVSEIYDGLVPGC